LIKTNMESSMLYIAAFVILIVIFMLICALAFFSKQPNKKK
jgi:heme/copper-type cytochrome/quinol oxidase subunit 2